MVGRSGSMAPLIAGRYRLGEEIGAGGTSRVFVATDERLGRKVAVKQLTARVAAQANPVGRDRFLREARTAANCLHPNSVTVYDAGEDDESLYMVMELVVGTTLATRLADAGGPLPFDEAARIADQVLAALGAAHHQGIVHRDVKPANVLLSNDGAVKLADFGIAKRFDDIEASITATGMVLGTPRYLAPEQTLGMEATPAADVYSAAIVVFEMLTGDFPVSGDTPVEVAVAHRNQRVPDLRTLRPEVPSGVADAISQALAKDPDERFPNADEFRAALATAWREADIEFAPIVTSAGAPHETDAVEPMGSAAPSPSATTMLSGPPTETASAEPTGSSASSRSATTVVSGPPTDVLRVLDRPHPRINRLAETVPPARLGLSAAIVFVVGLVLVGASGGNDLPDLARGEGSLAAPATADTVAGATDLWDVLYQLEEDPSIVGEAGGELLEGLRLVLGETDPAAQGAAATSVREAVAVWVADGHLDPAVAARVDELLAPVAAQQVQPIVAEDDAPEGGGGRGNGNGNGNGRGGGRD